MPGGLPFAPGNVAYGETPPPCELTGAPGVRNRWPVDHLSGWRHSRQVDGPAKERLRRRKSYRLRCCSRVGRAVYGLLSGEGPAAWDRAHLAGKRAGLSGKCAGLSGDHGLAWEQGLAWDRGLARVYDGLPADTRLAGKVDGNLPRERLAGLDRVRGILLAGEELGAGSLTGRPGGRSRRLHRRQFRTHAGRAAIAGAAAVCHGGAATPGITAGHSECILDAPKLRRCLSSLPASAARSAWNRSGWPCIWMMRHSSLPVIGSI
jgi:hypothetical protein